LAVAPDAASRAMAAYALALFHDNNSREAEAIPNYVRALDDGLPGDLVAPARAWLASSRFKTGDPAGALAEIRRSRAAGPDAALTRFLGALESRIARRR
jgi:hypothetical protein